MGLDGVLGFAGGGIDAIQYCGGLGVKFCSTAATLAVKDFGASFFGHGCEALLVGPDNKPDVLEGLWPLVTNPGDGSGFQPVQSLQRHVFLNAGGAVTYGEA